MIHQREIEILNILFHSDAPLSSIEIIEAGNKLSQSTVQAVLRKLLNEGFLSVEGVKHSGNVLSRTYRPTESAKEAIKKQYIDIYESIKYIVPVDEIIQELTKEKRH
jgi:predicted transcriptional regulator